MSGRGPPSHGHGGPASGRPRQLENLSLAQIIAALLGSNDLGRTQDRFGIVWSGSDQTWAFRSTSSLAAALNRATHDELRDADWAVRPHAGGDHTNFWEWLYTRIRQARIRLTEAGGDQPLAGGNDNHEQFGRRNRSLGVYRQEGNYRRSRIYSNLAV